MDPEPGDRGEDGAPGESAESKVERFLRPFVDDSPLWPVTLVILAHVVLFFTVFVLFAVRDRQLYAVAGLLLLLGVSGEWLFRDLRQRRLGLVSRALLLCWLLAVATAYAAHRTGIA